MITIMLAGLAVVLSVLRPTSRFLTNPSGLHMAFTGKAGELLFVWTSALPPWSSLIEITETRCGSLTESRREFGGESEWNYMCCGHAWNVVTRVLVTGLSDDCSYRYRVESGAFWTGGGEIEGRTAYLFGEKQDSGPVDVAVFGDMGAGGYSRLTREHLAEFVRHSRTDTIIHTGDLVYDLDGRSFYLTRAYFSEVLPFTSHVPYMVLPGNHERHFNFSQYSALFSMPVNEANDASSLFYSFNLGLGHFVALNTEFYRPEYAKSLQTQTNWLMADLEAAVSHRATTPWIVVLTHKPMYTQRVCKHSGEELSRVEMRKAVEHILRKFTVDLVVSSHEHNYERFCPMADDRPLWGPDDTLHFHRNPSAPVYIVCGTAGNEEGNDPVHSAGDARMLFSSRLLGFGLIHIENRTHLRWAQMESLRRTEIDFVWIEKS